MSSKLQVEVGVLRLIAEGDLATWLGFGIVVAFLVACVVIHRALRHTAIEPPSNKSLK